MTEETTYNEVASRYGLDPIPESVLRLTQLVSRQDADLDEIAAFVKTDPVLTKRILQLANPHADSGTAFTVRTVEQALLRNGIGCALLLGMNTPLSEALIKTFQTMLSLKLESLDVRKVPPLLGDHMHGTIKFSGKATGQVHLRLSYDSAKQIAARILGLGPDESPDLESTKDAVGELLNIMAGNFKSNLCDAGLGFCRLDPPRVFSSSLFHIAGESGGSLERMVFRAQAILLYVDARVNPWSQ